MQLGVGMAFGTTSASLLARFVGAAQCGLLLTVEVPVVTVDVAVIVEVTWAVLVISTVVVTVLPETPPPVFVAVTVITCVVVGAFVIVVVLAVIPR